jgi:hypothetical protein
MAKSTKYTVELTEAEVKAMEWIATSVHEWINHAAHHRAKLAINEIYEIECQRMANDPKITTIPADKMKVVLDSNIENAIERDKRIMAEQRAAIEK